jgi:hypothetical protein
MMEDGCDSKELPPGATVSNVLETLDSTNEVCDWIETQGGLNFMTGKQREFVRTVAEGKSVALHWPRREGKTTIILKLAEAFRALYPEKKVCIIGRWFSTDRPMLPSLREKYDFLVTAESKGGIRTDADLILQDEGPFNVVAENPEAVVASLSTPVDLEWKQRLEKLERHPDTVRFPCVVAVLDHEGEIERVVVEE